MLTAIGITPVGAKPSASSSWRLNSESPSARSTCPTSVASSRRPSAASRKSPAIVRREERRRRDVVILQDPRAVERRERLGHRRRQREVKDRDVAAPAPPDRRTAARPPRRSSSIVSAKMSDSWPWRAEHVAHAPRAVADGVAAMRGGHPLVDDHCRGCAGSAARRLVVEVAQRCRGPHLRAAEPTGLRTAGNA